MAWGQGERAGRVGGGWQETQKSWGQAAAPPVPTTATPFPSPSAWPVHA